MKAIKFIFIFISIVIIILSSCNIDGQIFSDEIYQDTIKQNIGGEIIRNIHYYNDFQSFNYDVKYTYKSKYDSISDIGSGHYYSQQLPVDEQLIKFGKWLIFKTNGDRNKDFIFICDTNTCTWIKYEISPYEIERTALWIEQSIESELNNWDTVSKVKNIDKNGNITILYVYAKKNRIFSFVRGKRKITYKINMETGVPKMTAIS